MIFLHLIMTEVFVAAAIFDTDRWWKHLLCAVLSFLFAFLWNNNAPLISEEDLPPPPLPKAGHIPPPQ